ncbi:MAG: putative deacylase [Saprospiraceae bacterium]|jgi:predicted deacylase
MTIKKHIKKLDLEKLETGKLHKLWLDLITDPFGGAMSIPLLVGRGSKPGPVLGLTAAVHGNELNGIPVIQRLFNDIENDVVSGTIIGVPVVNVPAFMRKRRRFIDGTDLNHIMPGKKNGTVSQVYAYRFINLLVSQFDYLIDLHTASMGRINSYYIRADMEDHTTAELANLQNAQIIVNNPPSDGTLRGATEALGIPAITLEVGNPNTYQRGMISSGITGLHNALIYLKMIEGELEVPKDKAILCKKSYWIYTESGGLLTVFPQVAEWVKKGDRIAAQYDIFGDKILDYFAPEDGIVIGKSVSPVNQTGGRILHFGIV